MMRYASADDFGLPESAFLICRFWLIDAWWWLGRREEARDLFIDALSCRNRYGLLSEDIHPQTGRLWGNFPQTYSHRGIDPDGNAPVSKLGGSVLARLILVSNRVPNPAGNGSGRAGGLEVALRSVFKRHPGVWFGWSGSVVPNAEAATADDRAGDSSYVLTDLSEEDHQEFYNGFANRVLWPILHYRLDLAEFYAARPVRLYAGQRAFCRASCRSSFSPDDVIWVHDYHFIPLGQGVEAARSREPHRLLPACAVSSPRGCNGAAAS